MLTINETSVNKKSNMKLILSCIASTAVIGSGALYLFSNARNNTSEGESFLSSIPKEFSGKMQMKWVDPFNYYKYSMSGVFNKYEDENGEWSFSGKSDVTDLRLRQQYSYIISEDRMYKTSNSTIDCLQQIHTIGYSQLKYDIMKGIEVTDDKLDEEVITRSKIICSNEHKKIVIETGDYGTLLICTKFSSNGIIDSGIFGKEWDLYFQTTDEKHNIVVPHENKKGFFYDENKELGCKATDTFETQRDYDLNFDKENKIDQHAFIQLEKFPFVNLFERNLKRKGARGGNSSSGNTSNVGGNYGKVPGVPSNFHNCIWMHGAGNHKGEARSMETTEVDGVEYFWDAIEHSGGWGVPTIGRENVTRYYSADTPVEEMHGYNRNGMLNGSSNYYSFDLHTNEVFVKESWYPHFIRGVTGSLATPEGVDINSRSNGGNGGWAYFADITALKGLASDRCHFGKFWEANSCIRLYDNEEIKNEMRDFWCDGGWNCEVAPSSDPKKTIFFTHSFGGIITMQALSIGIFRKGGNFIWGASQSPFRGSMGGNFVEHLCRDTGNTYDYKTGLFEGGNMMHNLIANGIYGQLWATFRTMGYCFNDNGGASFGSGMMIGSLAFEITPAWLDDFTIDYRYCGLHPGGVNMNEYDMDWTTVISSSPIHQTHGAEVMEYEYTGGSQSLWVLTYWACRFFSYCDQTRCNPGGHDCSWRGCRTDQCDHSKKLDWKNGKITFKGDGMVSLATCKGEANETFFDVDHMDPNAVSSSWDAFYNNFYSPFIQPHLNIKHFKTIHTHEAPNSWTWEFQQESGLSMVTAQVAGHEDGIGINGNSSNPHRAPLNWFTSVLEEAHYSWVSGTGVQELNLQGAHTFLKGDYNTINGWLSLNIQGGTFENGVKTRDIYYHDPYDHTIMIYQYTNVEQVEHAHEVNFLAPADYFVLDPNAGSGDGGVIN